MVTLPVTVGDSGRIDTTRAAKAPSGMPVISLRRLISRLGNIATEGRFAQTSSHNRVTGSPDPLYIIGLTTDPGFNRDSTGRVEPAFGNRSDITTEYGGSARTLLDTGFGSNITSRFEAGWRQGRVALVRLQVQVPDVTGLAPASWAGAIFSWPVAAQVAAVGVLGGGMLAALGGARKPWQHLHPAELYCGGCSLYTARRL